MWIDASGERGLLRLQRTTVLQKKKKTAGLVTPSSFQNSIVVNEWLKRLSGGNTFRKKSPSTAYRRGTTAVACYCC